jgi:hypothetical protein
VPAIPLPLLGACALAAACGATPDPVGEVLTAARHRIGWEDAGSAVVDLRATVAWAGPPYEVEILSAGSGAVRLAFVDGAIFGVAGDRGIAVLSPGTASALTDSLESFLRGHDVFFNLVAPGPRFGALRVAGTTEFAGHSAVVLVGTDAVGADVRLYYAMSDSMPLGYEVEDHLRGAGTVTTEVRAWAVRDGRSIPQHLQFRQGADTFDYTIRAFDLLEHVPDALFLALN